MLKKYFEYLYKSAERSKENDLKNALSKLPPGGSLLDIGCWDGKKTLYWAKALKTKNIFGLEIDKKATQKAKKRNIKAFSIDITNDKWPIKNNSIDYVLSNLVIEHLSDVDRFISESKRVLKKDGYTIVCTNNLASWHNIISLFFGWAPFDLTNSSPKAWSIGNPLVIHKNEDSLFGDSYCHKCIYTPRWLKEWYELYGFKLVKVYSSGYYPLPSIMAKIDKTHAAYMTLVFQKIK